MTNKSPSLNSAFKSRGNPEDWAIVARFFWRVALIIAIAGTVGMIGIGLWFLHSALSDDVNGSTVQRSPTEMVNKAQLDAVLHSFDERRSHFEELRGGGYKSPSGTTTASTTSTGR